MHSFPLFGLILFCTLLGLCLFYLIKSVLSSVDRKIGKTIAYFGAAMLPIVVIMYLIFIYFTDYVLESSCWTVLGTSIILITFGSIYNIIFEVFTAEYIFNVEYLMIDEVDQKINNTCSIPE